MVISKIKNLTDLYNKYSQRYKGNPKHSFSHFIRVISMINHHRTYRIPNLKFWNNGSF